MSEQIENNYLQQQNLMKNKIPRSSTGQDYLLLFTAFAFGLIGLWFSSQWFAPKSSEPKDYTALLQQNVDLEQKVKQLNEWKAATERQLADLSAQLSRNEQRIAGIGIASAVTTSNQAVSNIQAGSIIESDLAKAEIVVNSNKSWSSDNEALLLSLENHYATKGLSADTNNKLRKAMHDMYDMYINNLEDLLRSDSSAGIMQLNKLQNNINAPSKKYTLTPIQRTKINDLLAHPYGNHH